MAHIIATSRPVVVAQPTKTVLGKYVVFQFDSDPAGTGTLIAIRAKLSSYDQPDPETKERDSYNTTSKLMEVDVSIATKVDATTFELENDEPRDANVLALINNKIAYGQGCLWLGDPRDASTKCAMSTNAFGVTLYTALVPSDDDFTKVKIKGKITSPGVVWSSDVTLT